MLETHWMKFTPSCMFCTVVRGRNISWSSTLVLLSELLGRNIRGWCWWQRIWRDKTHNIDWLSFHSIGSQFANLRTPSGCTCNILCLQWYGKEGLGNTVNLNFRLGQSKWCLENWSGIMHALHTVKFELNESSKISQSSIKVATFWCGLWHLILLFIKSKHPTNPLNVPFWVSSPLSGNKLALRRRRRILRFHLLNGQCQRSFAPTDPWMGHTWRESFQLKVCGDNDSMGHVEQRLHWHGMATEIMRLNWNI